MKICSREDGSNRKKRKTPNDYLFPPKIKSGEKNGKIKKSLFSKQKKKNIKDYV